MPLSRTQEIEQTLRTAEATAAAGSEPGEGWLARYRDHVAYLLTVLRDFEPRHDLAALMRDRDRRIAALRLTVRRQRFAIAGLVVLVALGGGVALATVTSEAASRPAGQEYRTAHELTRLYGDVWCTAWEPAGEMCDGGKGCLWERWCTWCVGCTWWHETKCRPNSAGACPDAARPIDAGAGGEAVGGDEFGAGDVAGGLGPVVGSELDGGLTPIQREGGSP